MAKYLLAVVTLHRTSGLPEDETKNNLVFTIPDAMSFDDAANALTIHITTFYNQDNHADSIGYVAGYLSESIDRVRPADIDFYDITGHLGEDDDHGSPVERRSFVLADGPGVESLVVAEVASKVTLYAIGRRDAPVELADGTRPKQRHTGGIFLGPLWHEALEITPGGARLRNTFLRDVETATLNLIGATLNEDIPLSVWSRADATVRPVSGGHIDNAPDTIRSREIRATARRTFGVQL